jgi:hypothetical protein
VVFLSQPPFGNLFPSYNDSGLITLERVDSFVMN